MSIRLVVEGAEEAISETLFNLRANLETLKKSRKLTNKDLGSFAQVGEKTVWSWFKQGRTPDIPNLAPIAKVLEIPFSDLFLPAAEFAELHGESDGNFLLTVVTSRPSSRPSSASSTEARRTSRPAAASGKAVKKGSSKSANVAKGSPFRKPLVTPRYDEEAA